MNYTIARKVGTGAIIWSEDQKRYIIEQYTIYDKTLKELGEEFKVQSQSIRNLLRKENIPITDKKKRNFPRKSNYFNKIDTPDKAYWLGIMYSDGSISETTNSISLSLKDKEHVEKFKNALGAKNNKISEITDNRWLKPCYRYDFSIRDEELKKDLINLGVKPKKSFSTFHFPSIDIVPEPLRWHFIRGYFDGDGSIYFTNNKYLLSFVGNEVFLNDLKNILEKPQISLCQNSVSKITYDLKIGGKKDVLRILHNMYDDSIENIRLNRKYDIVQKCYSFHGASPLNQ